MKRSEESARAARATQLARSAVERQRAGQLDQATKLYEQLIELVPPSAAVLCNLGEAYRGLGRRQDAVVAFRRALGLQPELAAGHFNLGLTLDQLGRFAEAAVAYEAALGLDARLPSVGVYLLQALRDDAQYQRAIDAYEPMRARVPDSAELRRAIGNVLADVFRIDEAVEHFQRAIELAPASAGLRADYAAALVERGEVSAAIAELRRALALEPSFMRAHASLVYLLAFTPDAAPSEIVEEARRFDAAHALGLARPASYANARSGERPLRIGYVSPDFRAHPLASFLPEVLRQHDRTRVEVYCYSNVRKPDAVTEHVHELADGWRDIVALSDEAAAQLVLGDKIDVLVDLAMHSGGSRSLLFARKPAPVQACWLAYPGTTGLGAIDYRLTDAVLDPPGVGDEAYAERSLRLPHGFWCYAPPGSEPAVNGLPALTAGYITFGSPNSFKKVSDLALSLWSSVLEALPDSRMLIVAPAGLAWQRVERAFAARGVDSARLERLPHAPRAQYLAAIQRMDCVLDTAPYNGGTVSFDALHLGVPVLTLSGRTAASRAGATIAHHLELPELVAATSREYVAKALALSGNVPRLAALRAGLRARLRSSPLMNAPLFARGLEAAYCEMFEAWASANPVAG